MGSPQQPGSMFSLQHLEEREEALLAHLRFCPWCGSGFYRYRWAPTGSAEPDASQCPDCGRYVRAFRTVRETRTQPLLQELTHRFVCGGCGEPYPDGTLPCEGPPPSTAPCPRCARDGIEETAPIRYTEFLETRPTAPLRR